MKNYKNKYIGGSIIALMLAPAVHAQDTSTDFALDEIVVTATRTETTLQETSVAVTALSADQLERSNIRNLQDVASFVPSLTIGNRPGEGAAGGQITIRGMGNGAQDTAAAVGTYIDDVYFASDKGTLLGLMDVERIEVLRGPQGTLFGRNTIGGAIQYVTKAPSDEFEGYVKGSVGEWGTNEVSGAINFPISDTFAVRVAGSYFENDGWVKDELNGGSLGSADASAIRVRALWQPTDSFSADLKWERIEQNSKGNPTLVDGYDNNALFPSIARNNVNVFVQDPVQRDALLGGLLLNDSLISTDNLDPGNYSTGGVNSPSFFDHENNQYSLSLNYDISDNFSIKSITAFSEYSSALERDMDGTPLPLVAVAFESDEVEAFSQELRLSGKALDGRLNFTAGAYYFDSEELNTPQVATVGYEFLPQRPVPPVGPSRTNESLSFYTQGSYDFTDALTLTLGYRYTDEDVISEEQQGVTEAQKFNFTDSSPYIGVDYKVNDDAMVYAKASKGFRAGGRKASPFLPTGGSTFDPETAWTYEAGLRLDAAGGRLRLNPTVYFTDWKKIQFLNPVATPTGPVITTANAGDAEMKGLELEGLFAATSDLVFRGSYSYFDGSYTRVEPLTSSTYPNGVTFVAPPGVPFPLAPLPGIPVEALTLNSDLIRAPKHKMSVGVTHTYQLAKGGDIATSLDWSWTDEQRSDGLDNSPTLPSFGLMNGRIQYNAPGGAWNIAAYGKNMTNEYYLDGAADFAAGYTVGVRHFDVGKPREFGVAAAFNF